MDKTRILVAEDDPDTAQLLKRFLQKDGCDVVLAGDGHKAWQILQREDAPKLVILDWVMPGMEGIEVCRRLRETDEDIDTYVMLVSEKGKKQDVIAGLDSGADDYLVKPVDRGEFLARLRVAKRTLAKQGQLHQKIEEQRSLLRQYNSQGDNSGKNGSATVVSNKSKSDKDTDRSSPAKTFSPLVETFRPIVELESNFINMLAETGLSMTSDNNNTEDSQKAIFSALMPLILIQNGVWLDIRIETDRKTASELFHVMVGSRAATDNDLFDVLGDLLNKTIENLRVTFTEEDIVSIAPFLPKVTYCKNLSEQVQVFDHFRRYVFSDSAHSIQLDVIEHPAPVAKKTVRRLRPLDILVEDIYQPQEDDVVLLLSEGTVLYDRYIKKLFDFLRTQAKDFEVSIIQPSSLTKIFNNI
jgi:DNA-binding response OmpR family regulator